MHPMLFVVLLTAATGVGGLALGGALAALLKRESPQAVYYTQLTLPPNARV